MTVDVSPNLRRRAAEVRIPARFTKDVRTEHQPCIYFFVNLANTISRYSEYPDRKQPNPRAAVPASLGVSGLVLLASARVYRISTSAFQSGSGSRQALSKCYQEGRDLSLCVRREEAHDVVIVESESSRA